MTEREWLLRQCKVDLSGAGDGDEAEWEQREAARRRKWAHGAGLCDWQKRDRLKRPEANAQQACTLPDRGPPDSLPRLC